MNAPANAAALDAVQAAPVLVVVFSRRPEPRPELLLVPCYDPPSLVRSALTASSEKVRACDRVFSRKSILNVRRWVRALGVPPWELDDVVGDVLLRAWASWRRFNPTHDDPTRVRRRRRAPSEQGQGWLQVVTIRCTSRHRRRAKRRREVLVRGVPRQEGAVADPLALLIEREDAVTRTHALHRALEGLRPEWREVVIELGLLGTTGAELARRLKVAPPTISKRYRKGRAALRRRLTHVDHDRGWTHG